MRIFSRGFQAISAPHVVGSACIVSVVLLSLPSLGGYEPSSLFYWHPLLLSTSCLLLMPLGIIVYQSDSRWFPDHARRRRAHIILQSAATALAIIGYVAAYVAHEQSEKSHLAIPVRYWSRSFHVWAGLAVIAALVLQACGGAIKVIWRRRLPHSSIGLWIWCTALLPLLLAAYFRFSMKGFQLSGWIMAACICTVSIGVFAARLPKDDANPSPASAAAAAALQSPALGAGSASEVPPVASVRDSDPLSPPLSEVPPVALTETQEDSGESSRSSEGAALLDRPARGGGVRGRSPHGAIV